MSRKKERIETATAFFVVLIFIAVVVTIFYELSKVNIACAGNNYCCCETIQGGICCQDQALCTGVIPGCFCK